MRRDSSRQSAQLRERIAQQAAKLIAEHGIHDRQAAKRKAARQLGLAEDHALPGDDEVDIALREYHALFSADEQGRVLSALRNEAVAVMQFLAPFSPVLVGDVAKGIASHHAVIELEVYLDSSKAFEQFLLNHSLTFDIEERPGWTRYRLDGEQTEVWVKVLPESRMHGPRKEGVFNDRMTLSQLQHALRQSFGQEREGAGHGAV